MPVPAPKPEETPIQNEAHPLAGRARPYIMAHRGDSDHAPENTRAAFRLAAEAGADIIETDLWFTTDGHLVCHHDATLERMTGDRNAVESGIHLQSAAKFLERIGDHATNLAELVVFMLRGKDIRHLAQRSPKRAQTS